MIEESFRLNDFLSFEEKFFLYKKVGFIFIGIVIVFIFFYLMYMLIIEVIIDIFSIIVIVILIIYFIKILSSKKIFFVECF